MRARRLALEINRVHNQPFTTVPTMTTTVTTSTTTTTTSSWRVTTSTATRPTPSIVYSPSGSGSPEKGKERSKVEGWLIN